MTGGSFSPLSKPGHNWPSQDAVSALGYCVRVVVTVHPRADRDDRKGAGRREEGRAGGRPGRGRGWWPVFPWREWAGSGAWLPSTQCGQL